MNRHAMATATQLPFDEVLGAEIESPLDIAERHELRAALAQAIKTLPASSALPASPSRPCAWQPEPCIA